MADRTFHFDKSISIDELSNVESKYSTFLTSYSDDPIPLNDSVLKNKYSIGKT